MTNRLLAKLDQNQVAGVFARKLYLEPGIHQIASSAGFFGDGTILRADMVSPVRRQPLQPNSLGRLVVIGSKNVNRSALQAGAPIEHPIPVKIVGPRQDVVD